MHNHHHHNLEDLAIGYIVGKNSANHPKQETSHDSRGWFGWGIFFVIVSSLFALFVGPLMWPGGVDMFRTEPVAGIFVLGFVIVCCSIPLVLIFGIIIAVRDERYWNAEMLRQQEERQAEVELRVQANKKRQEIAEATTANLQEMLRAGVDTEKYLLEQVDIGRLTDREYDYYSNWANSQRPYIEAEKQREKFYAMLKSINMDT